MTRNLSIDIDSASRFLLNFDETSRITFQLFDDTKQSKRASHFTADFTDPEVQKYLIGENQKGSGIYFSINEMDGTGRSNAACTHIRCFALDLDGAPIDPVLKCSLEPHIVTESSPGKYHCYWLIEPIAISSFTDRAAAEKKFAAWQKALARKFYGDESIIDLARVLRVPGFWHQKSDPFQSRILPVGGGGIPYNADKTIALLNLEAEVIKVESEIKKPLADLSSVITKKIQTGSRHLTLLQYASKYAHVHRLGHDELFLLMQGINNCACENPIPEDQLERIVNQALTYAARERAEIDSVDFSKLLDKHKARAEAKESLLPDHLYDPPGMVGEMFRYILGCAIKPQPELALAAAFVACGTVMGRKIQSPTGLRTNLYFLGLIETGGGKDWPRQAIKKVFEKIGKPARAQVEAVTSDGAIVSALEECASQVFLFDEFGHLLKVIGSKNAGTFQMEIPTMLMKLYTSAKETFHAKAYADSKIKKSDHSTVRIDVFNDGADRVLSEYH